MIISASRRTDIPAFYSEWFMNRVRAGWCLVQNPFNANQISRISLEPADVDCVVFWTRRPGPLVPYLDELDGRGYKYYFQVTITGYGQIFEKRNPSLAHALEGIRGLAEKIGRDKVIWRYDPIFFGEGIDKEWHKDNFACLMEQIHESCAHVVISFMDSYRGVANRIQNCNLRISGSISDPPSSEINDLVRAIVSIAKKKNLEVVSCAEPVDLTNYGIRPGHCIDAVLISRILGKSIGNLAKDPRQRKECGCVVSRDIGSYDTCLHGCEYCYATRNNELAVKRRAKHDPNSPLLIGSVEDVRCSDQLSLF